VIAGHILLYIIAIPFAILKSIAILIANIEILTTLHYWKTIMT